MPIVLHPMKVTPAPKLVIRPARVGDATAMVRVREQAIWAKAASHYARADLERWVAADTASERVVRFQQEIADPRFVVLVAEANNDLVGFGLTVPAKGELRALYVKPNATGKIGCALLTELENRSFPIAESLLCDVSLNAASFYKANGYTEECRTDDRVIGSGNIDTSIRMKKQRGYVKPDCRT